ncbi:restriction endonuclease [Nocardia asteroides]|uniref:restriction endonuclease n=1 Tax=Nocardia asteroides TaxID=1824 RepID=UPI00366499F1
MSQHRRGADFERTVNHLLEDHGYECMRSAGSQSPVDVIAFKPDQVVMVQAKLDGRCTPAERAALLRVAGLVAAVPVVAYRILRQGVRFGTGTAKWMDWSPDTLDLQTPAS